MFYKHKQTSETPVRIFWSEQQFAHFISHGVREEHVFSEFVTSLDPASHYSCQSGHGQSSIDVKRDNHLRPAPVNSTFFYCDPREMLSNLSFLEHKIHHVQEIVCSIMNRGSRPLTRPNELAAQEQLVRADLTSIIIQLISTAGTLLPSIKGTLLSSNSSVAQLGSISGSPSHLVGLDGNLQQNERFLLQGAKGSDYEEQIKRMTSYVSEVTEPTLDEENDGKTLKMGQSVTTCRLVLMRSCNWKKEEILAPHTHFCLVCGKGFKRDANLRMHMRGRGDEYKSPSALAKPSKAFGSKPVLIKRYSCPFVGCKRNKEHKKFYPLKTILCVKNHYKRSHCDKSYTCSRCNSKKFSVIADLKTHEKHCGGDKWLCSCGTTFSRKDKLFGHVALFQGHTPALPLEETKGLGTSDQGQSSEEMTGTVTESVGIQHWWEWQR